ncbi:MAG TPA: hypothetical protein VGK67_05655 [Myxococcales bacterium]
MEVRGIHLGQAACVRRFGRIPDRIERVARCKRGVLEFNGRVRGADDLRIAVSRVERATGGTLAAGDQEKAEASPWGFASHEDQYP